MHRRDQLERIVDDFDGAVLMVSHDRHLLDACVGLDRRARQRPDPDLARRLLRLRRGAPARAREAAAAVRHAAEGDRATGGRGPALPALGAHHGQRARRQAGSRQADADRQDGEGRPPGAGAPQDGARAAQRRARRPAGDRARGRRRGVRPGRSGPARRRARDRPWRARRRRRSQRRRQDRAAAHARRHADPRRRGALDRFRDRGRLPVAGRGRATARRECDRRAAGRVARCRRRTPSAA